MDITRGSAKIPWIPFAFPPILHPIMWPQEDCLQAPAAMLLVCSESQNCYGLTSSLGQALAGHLLGSPWGPASWPGVLQTLKYPSYPKEALWDLHLCWASPIPYLACPTPFYFLKKNDLNKVLTWNPPLGNPTKAHANPHWGQVLCEAKCGVDKCDWLIQQPITFFKNIVSFYTLNEIPNILSSWTRGRIKF